MKTDHAAMETDLQKGLKRPGRRVTDQRRLILDAVRGTDAHPTAEWVYRKVRRRLPRISLGTVYRNLKLLAEERLIRELEGRGFGRYDGNTARHDHFTCQVCGQIYDLVAPADRRLDRHVASRTGFEILDRRIEFYGRCPACRTRARHRALARKPK